MSALEPDPVVPSIEKEPQYGRELTDLNSLLVLDLSRACVDCLGVKPWKAVKEEVCHD
jgi:hypothetical protein